MSSFNTNFLTVHFLLNRKHIGWPISSQSTPPQKPHDTDILLWVFIGVVSVCLLIAIIFLV